MKFRGFVRPSYLHNGISYSGKKTSLYWIRTQASYITAPLHRHNGIINHPQLDCLFSLFVLTNIKGDIKVWLFWPFVKKIQGWWVDYLHNVPVMRKILPYSDIAMFWEIQHWGTKWTCLYQWGKPISCMFDSSIRIPVLSPGFWWMAGAHLTLSPRAHMAPTTDDIQMYAKFWVFSKFYGDLTVRCPFKNRRAAEDGKPLVTFSWWWRYCVHETSC